MNSIFGRVTINNTNLQKAQEKFSEKYLFPQKKILFEDAGFLQVFFDKSSNPNFTESKLHIIISDCRIDNRDDLQKELAVKPESISDDTIILLAFEKWGERCLDFLIGDFAFAIWDKNTKKLFCARDHFGLKPFFYYHKDNTFVFSTDLCGILSQTDLSFSIDEQYIADTVSIIKSEKDRTQFSEIKKLPPAHYLIFEDRKVTIRKYWKLEKQKTLTLPEDQIIERFKILLNQAIRCRISNDGNVGTELSGGLDSSSVTSIANQFTNLKTFSHVLPKDKLGKIHPFNDERKQIALVSEFCNIKDSFKIESNNSGVLQAIKSNLDLTEYINQQNFNVFSDELYKKAADENVSVLLSGFGGDEGVTSKSNIYLKELAYQNNWKAIYSDLKNQKLPLAKRIKSFIALYIKTKIPALNQLLELRKKGNPWWEYKYENLALNPNFECNKNIKTRFVKNYTRPLFYSTQEINIERLTHNHVSQRLEYCSLAARRYGIEYRYPFFDKRLIEFYLSIPPVLKARNGIQRYAIRQVMDGLLPEEIQWRNDKSGATIPTVFMRTLNDEKQIWELFKKAKSNQKITQFIDISRLEAWFDLLVKRANHKDKNVNPGAFYNYLKLILYIEQNPELF